MPKTFYPLNIAAPYTPPTIRGAWDQTAGAITKALDSRKEGGGNNTSVQISEANASTTFDVLMARFISGPLAAQTIAGTIDVVLGLQESNAAADMNWHLHIYVTQGDSDTPRGTILTDYVEALGVNEVPTASKFIGLNTPQTLSSLAISAGDRLVVEMGYIKRENAATSRFANLQYGTLNSTTHVIYDDGVVAGTNVTTRSGFILFSQDILESTAVETRLTQAVLQVISRNLPIVADPSGGGSGGNGVDPAADVTLCGITTPLVWIEVQTDVGMKAYAKVSIALDSVYKEPRLLSISPITRAVSDRTGRFETASMTVTLIDTDLVLRGLAATGTLLNKRVDVYACSAAQLRAGSTPRRLAMMVIRDFSPESDLLFTLQLEDALGAILGEFGTPKPQPARLFTTTDFPNMQSTLFGKAVPIAYGLLSDEAFGPGANGATPAIYAGPRRLSDGTDWDEYVICGHAIKVIQSWFASDLSDVAVTDPASGGSGPRPIKMPPDTEGTEFLIPGFAGWTSIVGAPTYRDFNGRRYTVIYCKGLRSRDAKNGSCPISVNIGGIEDVGDGSGTMIDSLPRQLEHFLNNFVFQAYQTGTWPTAPTVNGYTRIYHASVEAVRTTSITRIGGSGYLGAWLLAWDGSQATALEVIRQRTQDGDFNLAVNRHGQIIFTMVYNLTAAVKAFVDVTDIIASSFTVKRRFEFLANNITYRFKKNFILDSRPDSARTGYDWWSDQQFLSVNTSDATAIAALGETRTLALDGWSLRDSATATDVALQLKTRLAYGPIYASFQTNLCGADVELGDNITVTHFGGMSSTGWTNKLLRVERMVIDCDALTVELEGQAV